MTTRLTSLQEAARHLLDEIEQGRDVSLDIASSDTETGALLLLVMEQHDAAHKRQVGVLIDKVSADTIRLSVPGDA
jgi:hypothetical protein